MWTKKSVQLFFFKWEIVNNLLSIIEFPLKVQFGGYHPQLTFPYLIGIGEDFPKFYKRPSLSTLKKIHMRNPVPAHNKESLCVWERAQAHFFLVHALLKGCIYNFYQI